MPVAANLYTTRKASDGSAEFLRTVQRQKDQYQGIWIVTSEGKVLAGHHDVKDHAAWAREVLETLDEGLKAFGPVDLRQAAPTDPLPFRGRGVRDDGSVTLALYGRQMLGGGRAAMPRGVEPGRAWLWDGPYRPDGPAMVDSLTLAAGEWAAFRPPVPGAGTEWGVPESVARKFVRILSASSDQSGMPRPEEAAVAELRAKVESVDSGVARVSWRGRWEAVRLPEGRKDRAQYGAGTASGTARVDVARNSVTSLLLVFDATVRHGSPTAAPVRTGGVVEWGAAR